MCLLEHLLFLLLAGSQITTLNECKSRCSLPIPATNRAWCRVQCPLRSLHVGSPVPNFNRRITTASNGGNAFRPRPKWKKITTVYYVPTTIKTTRETSKVFTIQSTQSSTTTAAATVTDKATKRRTKERFNLKSTSQRVIIKENIDNQNFYFKLAGILLGVCFVIFIACCVWRSMKKPHRVSFIDERVIVIHTAREGTRWHSL